MIENMIDAQEVAQILGISVQAVHRLCNRGSLSYLWLSGRRVFLKHVVIKFSLDPKRIKMSRKLDRETGQGTLEIEDYS